MYLFTYGAPFWAPGGGRAEKLATCTSSSLASNSEHCFCSRVQRELRRWPAYCGLNRQMRIKGRGRLAQETLPPPNCLAKPLKGRGAHRTGRSQRARRPECHPSAARAGSSAADEVEHQRASEPPVTAYAITTASREPSQKELGSNLLQVELNCFQSCPSAPPLHFAQILRLQVEVGGAGPS